MEVTDRQQVVRGARVYLHVSTVEQDLARQGQTVADAHAAGYYVAAEPVQYVDQLRPGSRANLQAVRGRERQQVLGEK